MEVDRNDTVMTTERLCDDYEVLMRRADFCSASAASEHARQCYIKAATMAPDRGEPYVGLGIVSLQQNDLAGAQAAFETACRLDERCEGAFCGLGIVHQQKGNCQEAMSMYTRCLELDSGDMTALLGLLEISHRTGDLHEIEYFLRQYLEHYPHDVAIMLCLVSVYLQAEQFGAARQILTDVLILDADNITAVDLIEELDHMDSQDSIEHIKEMYLMQPARGR